MAIFTWKKTWFLRFLIHVLILLLFVPCGYSLFFNFTTFDPNMAEKILFENDSFLSNNVLQLTTNQQDKSLTNSVGRASYYQAVPLWDSKSGKVTDFVTHFTFKMDAVKGTSYGHGMTFFIAPMDSRTPTNSSAGYLGLVNPDFQFNSSANDPFVAVEFDSFQDLLWDPDGNHVGINVNSIKSVRDVKWKSSIKNGSLANAWVSYNSSTKNLSVFLTYVDNPIFGGNSSLWYIVDLKEILPEIVRVGFSASTGQAVEIHNVISWSFNSTLEITKKNYLALIFGLVAGFGGLICALGIVWFLYWKSKRKLGDDEDFDDPMDDEFEKGTGPKRFAYRELSQVTNNFSDAGKLGEGGFGGVYKGLLTESNTPIAVKRVSQNSKQGKKEYISEVKIISRLRHRNLVQLIGWCHEKGEFLLVYEYMSNGSLDAHLFGTNIPPTWNVRYKIALGLASSLLYLHEEWEQCVLHRDIKSSNIMLDSEFNAKLGDFGLARLVDHDMGSQTTVIAGTMGYLAPECVTTGKASKESDVYSFGVVCLEIACGRRPVQARSAPDQVRLVEWVWSLYGKGKLLEAVDQRLNEEFDERQIECQMIVGLWCCHPDYTCRPSVRQVINVMNFEASLPNLPPQLPVPMYYAPQMSLCKFSHATTGSGQFDTQCSCSNCSRTTTSTTTTTTTATTVSLMSAGSEKALLNSDRSSI